MKLLADQDVYADTTRYLTSLGHDVVLAAQEGLSRATDADLLRVAHEQRRLLVTRDRDFGALVFGQGGGPGVIYLRMLPSTRNAVHSELGRILMLYSESDLHDSFVVVEPARHRIRKLGHFR
jgi:predicted nuclease of predicted toxin-antitoxin system